MHTASVQRFSEANPQGRIMSQKSGSVAGLTCNWCTKHLTSGGTTMNPPDAPQLNAQKKKKNGPAPFQRQAVDRQTPPLISRNFRFASNSDIFPRVRRFHATALGGRVYPRRPKGHIAYVYGGANVVRYHLSREKCRDKVAGVKQKRLS